MYKTNNFGWKLTHVLCILAHLGLVIAAAVAYVYNMSKDNNAVDYSKLVAPDTNPCSFALMGMFGSARGGSFDVAVHTLPMSCMAVGILGLVINIGLFVTLLAVDRTKATLTEGEQHWRKQIVTFFSCVFNLLLAGAGVGLASAMGIKVSESRSLITPMALAVVQSPLALTTALYDAVKNHRDGKDLLD
ncbi:hypothetical protein B0H63DRAFT_167187 [Podospora didyma]|uniref:Uncharacterized protein n=1 Tax=Podospora didyma TaxID=330526 RepID=A0AAE0NUF4_9PEZI|nr:hypothetical protein B0H63DRAFT_167187 [Podospora didyma]